MANREQPRLLSEIAWRFLRGRRSRLLDGAARSALAATGLGVTAMVIAMALMTGYRDALKTKLTQDRVAVMAYPLSASAFDLEEGLQPKEVRRLAGMVIDWMRRVARQRPEAAVASGFTRAVAGWDDGIDSICRGAPHIIIAHADKGWTFGPEDSALALSLLDLYATSIDLGACWGGYFYKAVNAHPPLFKALNLPEDHMAFGAVMLGYPKYKYHH